jgi:hypothetical protein
MPQKSRIETSIESVKNPICVAAYSCHSGECHIRQKPLNREGKFRNYSVRKVIEGYNGSGY